jgi:hypothetical protein
MSNTPVVAQSPVSLNVNGKQLMIPLSSLYFDDSGVLKGDHWPLFATYQADVLPLLERLRKQGFLQQGPKTLARPAFTATAITAGSTASIEIKVDNVVPEEAAPADSKADITVTETDLYTGLDAATLKDQLGAAAGAGKRPGLVFVSRAAAPILPKNGTYPAVAAAPGDPGTITVADNAGGNDAFELETRSGGADAILTSVEIRNADTVSGKFDLVASWTKTAAAVAISGIGAAFSDVITVAAPPGGFLAPSEGTVVLAGGADAIAVNPVKASATVLSQ